MLNLKWRPCATAALCALSVSLSSPAFAFGTIRSLGQNAEHERITRAALDFIDPKTLDQIAGKKGSFGAVGAPDRPGRGLLFEAEAHCDGGDYLDTGDARPVYPQSKDEARAPLDECRNFIVDNFERAVLLAGELANPTTEEAAIGVIGKDGKLAPGDCPFDGKNGTLKCRVLEALGLVFHASQDFYSHTNWSDEPDAAPIGPRNPPALGMKRIADYIDPVVRAPFPDGLISGCFEFPETLGCTYGGFGPIGRRERVKHDFLNKDNGAIVSITPDPKLHWIYKFNVQGGAGNTLRGRKGRNFYLAVEAAMVDTRRKWSQFEQRLADVYGERSGKRIACLLKADTMAQCPDIWEDYEKTCGFWREQGRAAISRKVTEWQSRFRLDQTPFSAWPTLETWERDKQYWDVDLGWGDFTTLTIREILEIGDEKRLPFIKSLPDRWREFRGTDLYRHYEHRCRLFYPLDTLKACAAAVRNQMSEGIPVPAALLDKTIPFKCFG